MANRHSKAIEVNHRVAMELYEFIGVPALKVAEQLVQGVPELIQFRHLIRNELTGRMPETRIRLFAWPGPMDEPQFWFIARSNFATKSAIMFAHKRNINLPDMNAFVKILPVFLERTINDFLNNDYLLSVGPAMLIKAVHDYLKREYSDRLRLDTEEPCHWYYMNNEQQAMISQEILTLHSKEYRFEQLNLDNDAEYINSKWYYARPNEFPLTRYFFTIRLPFLIP